MIILYFSIIDNHLKSVTLNLYLSQTRENFMTDYEQIFLSSGQEKQKLAIALKRFAKSANLPGRSATRVICGQDFAPP